MRNGFACLVRLECLARLVRFPRLVRLARLVCPVHRASISFLQCNNTVS